MLENYRRTHPQGRALEETFPEQPVRTANRRIADRAIWLGPNPAQSLKDIFPDIIVEFPSRRRRDRRRDYELKREEYLGAGAREYWVIDRFQRTMTVFRRAPEGVAERVLKENDSYRTDLLPGFELALSLVFEHVDRVRRRFS
jgi:Uma2 family endonuclease